MTSHTRAPLGAARSAIANALLGFSDGAVVDGKGYVADATQNLIEGVTLTDFEADLRQGDGNEMEGKFRAAHSSSALAVNNFAPFKHHLNDLKFPGIGDFDTLQFERKCPHGLVGRRSPNLDVFAQGPSDIVAIESKFLEYLSPHIAEFSPAYMAEILDGRRESPWFGEMLRLIGKPTCYRWLNAAQLVKHAFGILHTFPERKGTLLYLFWEPSDAASNPFFAEHRAEIGRFKEAVSGSNLKFEALSYPELWSFWLEQKPPAWLGEHIGRVKNRYSVSIAAFTQYETDQKQAPVPKRTKRVVPRANPADTAGLGSRYRNDASPFLFYRKGTRVRVDLQKFVPFMADHLPGNIEEAILLDGLRAWVICPVKISGGVWHQSYDIYMPQFVSGSMAVRTIEKLDQALGNARYHQLISDDDSTKALLNQPSLAEFPFDVLFALGGLSAAVSVTSRSEIVRNEENQKRPLQHVATLMYVLDGHYRHERTAEKKNGWGINRAAEAASSILGNRHSKESIKDSWDLLKPAAPLIYASTLADGGLLFQWLMGFTDECFYIDGSAHVIKSWFDLADSVFSRVLSKLPGPRPAWPPLGQLQVDADLPPPLLDKDWAKIMFWQPTMPDEAAVPPRKVKETAIRGW
jgi:hypothetical protein